MPSYFAKTLTYPQPVTPFNYSELAAGTTEEHIAEKRYEREERKGEERQRREKNREKRGEEEIEEREKERETTQLTLCVSLSLSLFLLAVIRGPAKHPGANAIEDEFGNKILLKADDEQSRLAIAKTLQLSSNNSIKTKVLFLVFISWFGLFFSLFSS